MKKKNKKIERMLLRKELKTWDVPKHDLEAKGRAPQAGMLVIRDLLLGGFIGGMLGAGLGRWSLAAGALSSGLAYYFGAPGLAGLGIGMAAAGLNAKVPETTAKTGSKESLEEAKKRMQEFTEGFKQKLWLDKLQKKEPEKVVDETTAGLGETTEDPLSELEEQIQEEAEKFQAKSSVETNDSEENVSGFAPDYEPSEDEDWEDETDPQSAYSYSERDGPDDWGDEAEVDLSLI